MQRLLFQQCRLGIANVDDEYFADVFSKATCRVETFGFSEKADLRAEDTHLVSRPGTWESPTMRQDLWISMWRSIFRASSVFTIH